VWNGAFLPSKTVLNILLTPKAAPPARK